MTIQSGSSACFGSPRPSRCSALARQLPTIGLLTSLLAAGCTGSQPDPATSEPVGSVVHTATAIASSTPPSSAAPTGSTTALPQTTLTAITPRPPRKHTGPLAAFHDALQQLERGERTDHARIMWLGDSHAQADFWPWYLRQGLQKRFGHGGLGFVHIGYKNYRHGGIKLNTNGSWRMRPKQPSTVKPWDDGIFGLGGILHAGYAGPRWAYLEVTDKELTNVNLRWDLCYKLGQKQDAFWVRLGDGPVQRIENKPLRQLLHLELEHKGLAQLKVTPTDGRPDFCGVVIEVDPKEGAGVVLDNLGINGARYATPLAWNEEGWAAEVRRRKPELVIIEYGGNEAGDGEVKVAEYKQNALDLIARVRRISPEASCLVIGLSDRVDVEPKIAAIRDLSREAAAESKCMFWDTYERMGGKGSLRKWRADNKAYDDGIHLNPQGYAVVAEWLLADILAGY